MGAYGLVSYGQEGCNMEITAGKYRHGFLTVKIAQARLEALRRLYFFVKFKF